MLKRPRFDARRELRLRSKRGIGDKTVPNLSSERCEIENCQTGLNYNSTEAEITKCISRNKTEDALCDHVGLVKAQDVRQEILNILDLPYQPSIVQQSKTTSMIIKTRDKNGPTGATLPTVNQGYYLSISGGDRVSITDESGITNTPIGDAGFELGVPGVSFAGGIYEGEGSYQEIAMPADEGAYTIKFRTGTDSIDIEILKGVGNTSPNLAIRYIDLELPADVECLLTFDPQGVPDLRYDSNGDGTYDVVVPAHVRVSGAAAQDVTAPAVGFAKDSATGLVSIDATDSESGVGTIYYRYAGDASFQIYTAPFVPTANSLEAFADDNVGNRSSPVTASLVSISGRVMDSSGRPISGAFVTLTDPQGGARTFRTNTFGYYRFDDVLTGQSYELAVSSRRYTFEPRSVALTGELTGFDFTANP